MDSAKFLVASNNDIKIFVVRCGHIDTNTGFIENIARKEAILIDAPFGAFEVSKKILHPETKIVANLFTHGHWDHIGDAHIFRKLGAKTYAHKLEKSFIEQPKLMSLFSSIQEEFVSCPIDVEISEDTKISVSSWMEISCKWIQGHSVGGLVFYMKSLSCIFTGDTLFKGCIGRSDLPGGNERLLIDGIKEKILILPNETIVIPGHGIFSTVGNEKANNEFVGHASTI